MSTLISRIGFCNSCYREGRPRTGQPFLVMGSTHNKLKVMGALHHGKLGFVPFTYRLKRVVEQKVYYQRICSICGSYAQKENGKTFFYYDDDKWSGYICTSLTNWNALVLLKDVGFEI